MKTPTFILSVILFSVFSNCLGQSYSMPQNSSDEIPASDFELYADSIILDVSEGITYEQINVSARILNTGTLDTYSFTCMFHLSSDTIPDSKDYQIRYMRASCPAGDTAFANCYFNVPLSMEPGDYYVLCQLDFDNKYDEEREDNNLSWENFTILIGTDLELSPELLPDTMVVCPNTNFAFDVKLKNTGSLTFYDYISFTQYLSVDTILDSTLDIKLGMEMIKTGAYSGMSEDMQLEVPIGNDVPYGKYYWFVVLDNENLFLETNEENNSIRRPMKVLDPEVDLVVTDLEFVEEEIEIMEAFAVSYTIRNKGPKSVNTNFYNRIYFSSDDKISGGDYYFQPQITNEIPGDSEIEIPTILTLNQSMEPGTYYVIVSLDWRNDITERDENNIFIMNTVEVKSNDVNLAFRDGAAHYDSISDRIVLWGNLENKGAIATWRQFNVGVYVSSDSILDLSDHMITYPLAPVIPGNSEEYLNYTLGVPNIPAGDYYYILNADEYGMIMETNENDNTWAYKVNFPNDIPMIDLSIVVAGIEQEDENIDIYVLAENIGGTNSTTRTRCKYYFSDDDFFDEEDIYIDDIELSSLDKNEQKYLHYVIPINQLQSNIIVMIDGSYSLHEANEDNNTAFLYLPVDIGLFMQSAETDCHPGKTISVEYILKNETDFISDSISIGYYISSDQDLSSDDKLIYSYTAGPASKGVNVSVSSNISIPDDTEDGKYYLIVQANERYLEYEQNTENNLGSMILNVSKNVGLEEAELSPDIPEIYPIPATSVLYINSPTCIESYRIVDNIGRYCRAGEVNREQFSLNVDGLEAGFYCILMKTKKTEYSQRFIIGQR